MTHIFGVPIRLRTFVKSVSQGALHADGSLWLESEVQQVINKSTKGDTTSPSPLPASPPKP